MSETKELLRRGVGGFEPTPDAFERVIARRDRKQRNQRVAAGVLGLVVFSLAAIGLVRLLGSEHTPASNPRDPFLGVWISTSDADGGMQTMTVQASGDGAVEIVVRDDVATVCGGTPSTMTGTGRIEGGTALVIPSPVYTCDNGSEPETLSGPPLAEQLRDWNLFLDAETDTLSDGFGGVWRREGAEDSPTEGPNADLEPLWPQTSMEEVRQAQELADAGDPDYTWQVAPYLAEVSIHQHHPYVDLEPGGGVVDAEIFARFLEEQLGWEEYLWDEAFAHPDGLDDGEVVYVRCAPGRTNPLSPTDPERPGCAPTIDELHYETVYITVAQLDRQGPQGIWVVTGWEMVEPVTQVDPRVVEAEATALLEDFLRARIDGQGAEGFVDFGYDPFPDERVDREIPLLYTTSAGAPYDRSKFEVVDGPVWPEGQMQFKVRLFADNGETVVEQLFTLERDEAGRLRLVYDFQLDGRDGPVVVTTENGSAVPVEYGFLDGEVTYRAAYPFEPSEESWDRLPDRTAVVGLPFHKRNLRLLLFLADPQPIGPGCEVAPAPADAEALARSLRSDADFDTTAPVPATIGGLPALQIDVLLMSGATECAFSAPDVSGTAPLLFRQTWINEDQLVRLYLLDLPEGSSARVLAIAVMAADVEGGLEAAAPILDSIEFHPR